MLHWRASLLAAFAVNLYLFLLVVISLSCGSLPPAEVVLFRAVAASGGIVLAWSLLCHVGARMCAHQVRCDSIDALLAAKLLERQLTAFRWLGLGVVVLCLGGFGLARGLDSIPLVSDSSLLESMILLTPGLLIVASTWSAEHYYGVLVGYTDANLGNHLRTVWESFRGHIAWLVAPVLVVVGLSDAIALLPVGSAAAGWITASAMLLFIPIGLPWIIRRLFKTTCLDETTEAWIARLTTAVGLCGTRVRRWETGGESFNAVVVGFLPPLRTLLISDRLLDELPKPQIAMVVLHEAAHMRRRHVPIRMLAVLPSWAAAAVASRIAGDHEWAMLLGSCIGILLTLGTLRVVAYRTEYDADVEACRMAARISEQIDHVPSTYEDACEALAAALMRVTLEQPSCRRATWLHPGVADRVNFMRRRCIPPITNKSKAGTVASPA